MTLEQLLKLLAKILNTSEAKIKEYLEGDEGEDAVTRISAEALQKRFDDGHKKGLGKGLKDLVKTFNDEFDFDVTGSTLEEVAASLKTGFETLQSSEISEDTIKASDAYKDLQAELVREKQTMAKQVEKKVKEVMKEKDAEHKTELKAEKRKNVETDAYIAAEEWLKAKKAILNEDPVKRRKQIQLLVNQLKDYDLEKDEDGNILISKDGNAKTNKTGHNASLPDLFEEHDHLYVFQSVNQRKSTGLDKDNNGGGEQPEFKHFKGEVPKTKEEMNKVMMDYNKKVITPEAYQEVRAAYVAATT